MCRTLLTMLVLAGAILAAGSCRAGDFSNARLRKLLALSQGYGVALELPGDCSHSVFLGAVPVRGDVLAHRLAIRQHASLAALREAQRLRELERLARIRRELLRQQQLRGARGLLPVVGLRIGF